jgi:phage-related minor tail protein
MHLALKGQMCDILTSCFCINMESQRIKQNALKREQAQAAKQEAEKARRAEEARQINAKLRDSKVIVEPDADISPDDP